jgi:hypothetical protein
MGGVAVGPFRRAFRLRLAYDNHMIFRLVWVKYVALIALAAGLTGFLVYFAGFAKQPVDSTGEGGRGPASIASTDAPTPGPPEIAVDEADAHVVPPGQSDLLPGMGEASQRADAARSDPAAEFEPEGPFSVSGMVVDEAGIGVGDVEVLSRLKHAFDADEASGGGEPADDRTVLTDIDGFYEIRGVADGEYRIQTEPTDRYEAASAVVRAGSETADLVLRARRPALEIGGTVRGDGDPLSGVEVAAVGQSSGAVHTDENGSYELELQVSGGKPNYTLRFARDGYREKRSVLTSDELAVPGRIRVDADLEPSQALVEVTGAVRDREGDPVSGETVQLYSKAARQRYTAVSGHRGEIRFPEVETSDDYSVSVRPAEAYQDYVVRNVDIGVAGASLDVVLEPRSYGKLAGQMVDPDGQPVPGFSLWLRNTEAINQPALLVTADQQGFFEVDRVEAGALVFETRGSPLVSISGLRLSPGETRQVRLVLDWGNHQVAGLVMDDMGQPVSATELFVTSVRREGGLRAQAVRRAVTDETGYFLVAGIGSGYHTVRVDAPGYRAAILDHQAGRDNPEVIIRLERVYSHGM